MIKKLKIAILSRLPISRKNYERDMQHLMQIIDNQNDYFLLVRHDVFTLANALNAHAKQHARSMESINKLKDKKPLNNDKRMYG